MPRHLHCWAVTAALACALLAACGGLKNGWLVKGPVAYRVAALDEAQWAPVGFSDNDVAWIHKKTGQVLSVNATCDGHGDPSLEVLTGHLLFGFSDRVLQSRKLKPVDGRDALFSKYQAKLDGVEVELELVVLKKNGCVHDFQYVAPKGQFEKQVEALDTLVAQFTTEGRP